MARRRSGARIAGLMQSFQSGDEPTSNLCGICEKNVYPMDMIRVDKKAYHKRCFKCKECNCQLSAGNYKVTLDGVFYCKPHILQLFTSRGGKYDEGGSSLKFKRSRTPQGRHKRAETHPTKLFVPHVGRPRRNSTSAMMEKMKHYENLGAKDTNSHGNAGSEDNNATFEDIQSGRCKTCGDKIDMDGLKVEDETYHKECFVCGKCQKHLTPDDYIMPNEYGPFFCLSHKPRNNSIMLMEESHSAAEDSDVETGTSGSLAEMPDIPTTPVRRETDDSAGSEEDYDYEDEDEVMSPVVSSSIRLIKPLDIVASGRCDLCMAKISETKPGVFADTTIYHNECFKCLICKDNLTAENFHITQLGPFCLKHGNKLAPKTPRTTPLKNEFWSPVGKKRKSNKSPNSPTETKSNGSEQVETVESEDNEDQHSFINEGHGMRDFRNDRCKLCLAKLGDNYEFTGDFVFHTECFVCIKCKKKLTPETCEVTSLAPYCVDCANSAHGKKRKTSRTTHADTTDVSNFQTDTIQIDFSGKKSENVEDNSSKVTQDSPKLSKNNLATGGQLQQQGDAGSKPSKLNAIEAADEGEQISSSEESESVSTDSETDSETPPESDNENKNDNTEPMAPPMAGARSSPKGIRRKRSPRKKENDEFGGSVEAAGARRRKSSSSEPSVSSGSDNDENMTSEANGGTKTSKNENTKRQKAIATGDQAKEAVPTIPTDEDIYDRGVRDSDDEGPCQVCDCVIS